MGQHESSSVNNNAFNGDPFVPSVTLESGGIITKFFSIRVYGWMVTKKGRLHRRDCVLTVIFSNNFLNPEIP